MNAAIPSPASSGIGLGPFEIHVYGWATVAMFGGGGAWRSDHAGPPANPAQAGSRQLP